MYALFAALISAVSNAGGKAQDADIARIKLEGATSRQYIQTGQAISTAGWVTIAKGYGMQDILANQVGRQYLGNISLAQQRAEEQRRFKRMIIGLALLAGSLLVLFLVIKKDAHV